MGCTDYHLHQFTIGNKKYTESPETKEDGYDGGWYHLSNLIKQKGRKFSYLYDFGDYWEHEILIEDSRYFNPDLQAPVMCLEGERACPPEDVGSVPGYYHFCEVIADPEHEEYDHFAGWYAGFPEYEAVFEREKFDLEKVNYELMKYLRWSRDRLKLWADIG
jgi:hypothetical protein